MSQADEQRRRELASFLRQRRHAVSPRVVGLPVDVRRRTPGLRREEVAVFAGLSPTWYTYLEQARDVRPSPEVLDRLAGVLQLTDDERRYLHLLGSGPPVSWPPAGLAEADVAAVRRLVAAADPGDHPLYAIDHTGALLACNDAAAEWYADWRSRTGLARNLIWWLFTDPQARAVLVDWADEARDIAWRVRAVTARYPTDGRLLEVVDRLRAASTEFEEYWQAHEVRGQRARLRRLRHPVHGVRGYHLSVLHPEDQPSVSLALHLPVPPGTG